MITLLPVFLPGRIPGRICAAAVYGVPQESDDWSDLAQRQDSKLGLSIRAPNCGLCWYYYFKSYLCDFLSSTRTTIAVHDAHSRSRQDIPTCPRITKPACHKLMEPAPQPEIMPTTTDSHTRYETHNWAIKDCPCHNWDSDSQIFLKANVSNVVRFNMNLRAVMMFIDSEDRQLFHSFNRWQ